tara:strand:- start:846 stop:1604 length:759 start_codon:yes stop_codon:yes gene_type:complete
MFFVLSKTLQYFIFPLTLIFFSLIAIFAFYHRKHTQAAFGAMIIALYVLCIPITSNLLGNWLEHPRSDLDIFDQKYDVVVVLTGMLDIELSKKGNLEFGDGVDRILAGIFMVQDGIADKLLITGGSGSLFDQSKSEAVLLKEFAIKSGLSSSQIIIDPVSRNTHENAVNTATLVRERGYENILLITSAFHMWRAEEAFNKQGVFPEVYPVDFRTSDTVNIFDFLPSVGALSRITWIIHELVGVVVYRLQGYT